MVRINLVIIAEDSRLSVLCSFAVNEGPAADRFVKTSKKSGNQGACITLQNVVSNGRSSNDVAFLLVSTVTS
jgi:hypothetical protein